MNIKEGQDIIIKYDDKEELYYVNHVIDQRHFFAHIYSTYENQKFKTKKEMYKYLYEMNKNPLFEEMVEHNYEPNNIELKRMIRGWCIVKRRNWDGSKKKRPSYKKVEIKII